jgi:hypothetical protein
MTVRSCAGGAVVGCDGAIRPATSLSFKAALLSV